MDKHRKVLLFSKIEIIGYNVWKIDGLHKNKVYFMAYTRRHVNDIRIKTVEMKPMMPYIEN